MGIIAIELLKQVCSELGFWTFSGLTTSMTYDHVVIPPLYALKVLPRKGLGNTQTAPVGL